MTAALGRRESDRLLRERRMVEVRCRFCGERYELGADQVAEVYASPAQPAGEDGVVTLHGWHAAT